MSDAAGRFALPPALAAAWDRASARERRVLVAGAVVVIGAVLWAFLWRPVTADIEPTRDALALERARLATARAEINEMASLAKDATPTKTTDIRSSVERVLVDRGLRPAVTVLDTTPDSAHLVFGAVSFPALVGAIDALAREERLRVVEATMNARVESGMLRADLTLAR